MLWALVVSSEVHNHIFDSHGRETVSGTRDNTGQQGPQLGPHTSIRTWQQEHESTTVITNHVPKITIELVGGKKRRPIKTHQLQVVGQDRFVDVTKLVAMPHIVCGFAEV